MRGHERFGKPPAETREIQDLEEASHIGLQQRLAHERMRSHERGRLVSTLPQQIHTHAMVRY